MSKLTKNILLSKFVKHTCTYINFYVIYIVHIMSLISLIFTMVIYKRWIQGRTSTWKYHDSGIYE